MLHAERAPDGPEAHVPRGTTPTWEMELLLSGATVFGLLQLPGFVDPIFYGVFQRADDALAPNLLVIWMYAKGAVVTLGATFVAHLALRAYWIALVGLHSVHPGGLRWERLRSGPVQRATLEPVASSIPERIEAADNRASRVFAFGVAIAVVLIVPFGVVSLAIVVAVAVRALGGPDLGRWALIGGLMGVMGPFLLATAIDRIAGKRLGEGRWPWRALARLFRAYHRIGLGASSNSLLGIFQSHEGLARTLGLLVGAMFAVFTVVFLQFEAAMGSGAFGDFAGLPDDDPGAPQTSSPVYYATQRRPDQVVAMPYLPDRVVRGPYVELFVPYRPARHAPAIRQACAEAVAVAERGGPPDEALACLRGILDLRLDGAPQAVALQASSDPVTGMRGVLAMIPADGLAQGRHEITIRRLPRPGRAEDPPPFRIPFWR